MMINALSGRSHPSEQESGIAADFLRIHQTMVAAVKTLAQSVQRSSSNTNDVEKEIAAFQTC